MRLELTIRPTAPAAPSAHLLAAPPQATRQELQQGVRQDIQQVVQQTAQQLSRQASQEAAQAAREGAGAARDAAEAVRAIRVERDGKLVTVGPEGVSVTAVPPTPPPPDIVTIPSEAVMISIAFFIMVAVIVVGFPIARAFARRMDRGATSPRRSAPEQQEQLRRMEQALEAISVEVERISENQRFVTRLITEARPADMLPAGRASATERTPASPGQGR